MLLTAFKVSQHSMYRYVLYSTTVTDRTVDARLSSHGRVESAEKEGLSLFVTRNARLSEIAEALKSFQPCEANCLRHFMSFQIEHV